MGAPTDSDSAALRELLDRVAIDELINRYYHGLDTRDYALFETVFAPDAVFTAHTVDGTSHPQHGREAIIRALHGVEPFTVSHHGVRNRMVTLDGDRARGNIYAMDALAYDPGSGMRVRFHGLRYIDEYARTDAGWRITRRDLYELWEYEAPDVTMFPELPLPR
ncbi:MAG: nuclear transport factor 2 family protein [Gammaproteobacteria bacterium]